MKYPKHKFFFLNYRFLKINLTSIFYFNFKTTFPIVGWYFLKKLIFIVILMALFS